MKLIFMLLKREQLYKENKHTRKHQKPFIAGLGISGKRDKDPSKIGPRIRKRLIYVVRKILNISLANSEKLIKLIWIWWRIELHHLIVGTF